MIDIGWSEMLIVAVVAVIVIGPKDLPKALRTAGQWVGKARGMAREFRSSIDDMVRESELQEIREQANSIANFDVDKAIDAASDPSGTSSGVFDKPRSATPADAEDQDKAPTGAGEFYANPENVMAPPHSLTQPDDATSTTAPTSETASADSGGNADEDLAGQRKTGT